MNDDTQELWQKVKDNHDRLNSCKRHCFDIGRPPYAIGEKAACSHCGGELPLLYIRMYAMGYEAAGGNPNDIIPGYYNEDDN